MALRANLCAIDAGYVALAELIGATLVTLDRRIPRAPDLCCTIATPYTRRGSMSVTMCPGNVV